MDCGTNTRVGISSRWPTVATEFPAFPPLLLISILIGLELFAILDFTR